MYLVIHLDSRFAVLTEWHLRSQAKERSWVQSCIYVNIYIYIVCVCMCICIYINLDLKIYVYVNIHWHTHISLSIILYTIQMLTTYILNYASLLRAFQVNPENLLTPNPWLPWNWHSSRTAAAMYGYVILHTSNLRYHTTSELFSPLYVHIYI